MISLGIIFGGASYEHEISIITAYQLKKKLEEKYEIHLIYVSLDGQFYNADKMLMRDFRTNNLKKLKKLNFKKLVVDVIVGAMHGENGEDGLAYDFARINNFRYLGCEGLAASISIDKYRSYCFLANNGIKMIDTKLYTYDDYLHGVIIDIFPCILKPVYGGSSLGIEVVMTKEELETKLTKVFKYSKELVVQPYYVDLEEYNLALSEEDYSNLERINKKAEIFSFDNKYSDSFKVMHQSLVSESSYVDFCEIARKVYKLINASGIIRIDFFMIDNEIYVNEVNTTPGALAMYLFPDFLKTFETSLNNCLLKEIKIYPNNHFLLKNNIDK